MLKEYLELTDEEVVAMKRGAKKAIQVIGISGAAITLYLVGVRKGKKDGIFKGYVGGLRQGIEDGLSVAMNGVIELDLDNGLTYNSGTRTFKDKDGIEIKKI